MKKRTTKLTRRQVEVLQVMADNEGLDAGEITCARGGVFYVGNYLKGIEISSRTLSALVEAGVVDEVTGFKGATAMVHRINASGKCFLRGRG